MKVMRKIEKDVKKFKVGDQITLGRYTATAVAKDDTGTTFCLDQVYGEKPMKYGDRKRIKALYNSKMFNEIRDLMVSFYPQEETIELDPSLCMLRSPTAEEIWGKKIASGIHPTTIEGADKRWEAMKDSRNRIGFKTNGHICSYWVDSLAGKDEDICTLTVIYNGQTGAIDLEDAYDVEYVYFRPVFKLGR